MDRKKFNTKNEKRSFSRKPKSNDQRHSKFSKSDSPRERSFSKPSEERTDEKRPFSRTSGDEKKYDNKFKKPSKYAKPTEERTDEKRPYSRTSGDEKKYDNKFKKPSGYSKPSEEHTEKKRPYSKDTDTGKKFDKKIRRPSSPRRRSESDKPYIATWRLNRFLANAGICSRREADEYIKAGVVSVNGKVVTEMGTKITFADEIRFNNELIRVEKKAYVLLNKPKDFITTTDDERGRKSVMQLIRGACREKVYPIGRLDRNTTGVLLFTNDGELAAKLTHPRYAKKKIYHAHLDKKIKKEDMEKLVEGVVDKGETLKADVVSIVDEADRTQVGVEIHTGQNRVIRRMFETLGYQVIKLDRVYFAGLTKKGLVRGAWRLLTPTEINMLKMGAFE
jgi:23S rRNA pseudouridine2605 synthase